MTRQMPLRARTDRPPVTVPASGRPIGDLRPAAARAAGGDGGRAARLAAGPALTDVPPAPDLAPTPSDLGCVGPGVDPDLWFDPEPDAVTAATAICRTCPAQTRCATAADTTGARYGIWGGINLATRHPHHTDPDTLDTHPTATDVAVAARARPATTQRPPAGQVAA